MVGTFEDAGIIGGYRAELNLERLGFPITAIIRVSTPEPQFARLKAVVAQLSEVLDDLDHPVVADREARRARLPRAG